jgi:hypothetical protein
VLLCLAYFEGYRPMFALRSSPRSIRPLASHPGAHPAEAQP